MNALLLAGMVVLLLVAIVIMAIATYISWVAQGSPDVNGDADRDAGMGTSSHSDTATSNTND